jgi:alpha-beta hydrolase superfamily lysophospholipase
VSEERFGVAVGGVMVAAVLHLPEGRGRVACIVACHGLHASKESDKYLMLGAELPGAGFGLARFDFRGCGESGGVEEETNVASRVEDAEAVLGALAAHPRLDGRFGLLGSSLGGFVALHVAAARRDGTPVVTWNAPADLDDLRDRADSPGLGPALRGEVAAGRYAATPAGVARHLVIQGGADDVVPPVHAWRLHARAAEPRAIAVLPGADHRLSEPAHRKQAVALSIDWLRRFR